MKEEIRYLQPEEQLYRVVTKDNCTDHDISNIALSLYYDYGSKVLCFYHADMTTPSKAVKAYCAESKRDVSEIVGVVKISAARFPDCENNVLLDGDPVKSHVSAYFHGLNKTQRELMRIEMLYESQENGWQV